MIKNLMIFLSLSGALCWLFPVITATLLKHWIIIGVCLLLVITVYAMTDHEA
jgi:hypothetical protein